MKKDVEQPELGKPNGYGEVEIVRDDEGDTSQLAYFAMAQDPWLGAIIEDGYRHIIVTEHQAALGLGSNLISCRQLGYTIAPAPVDVRKRWDESKRWVMRIPQALYDQRKAGDRARAAANRGAVANPTNTTLVDHTKGKVSLNDLTNG